MTIKWPCDAFVRCLTMVLQSLHLVSHLLSGFSSTRRAGGSITPGACCLSCRCCASTSEMFPVASLLATKFFRAFEVPIIALFAFFAGRNRRLLKSCLSSLVIRSISCLKDPVLKSRRQSSPLPPPPPHVLNVLQGL